MTLDAQQKEIAKLKAQVAKLKKKNRYLDKYADIQAYCLQYCYEFDQTNAAVKEALDKLEKLK